jgi:predicted amidophosphoribosyltransferase
MRSCSILLPDRLTQIDDTNRGDHPYLEEADRCFYFGEYFAGKSYKGGPTNQLVFNFKCKPTVAAANVGRAHYKNQAIQTIAGGMRRVIGQQNAERYTWVPIPPSKVIGDPDYDDRMLRALHIAFQGYNTDIRPLVRQTVSTAADHEQEDRLTRDALRAVLAVDLTSLQSVPLRDGIILVDDVLNSGKHFKESERQLRSAIPGDVAIAGLFVARCLHQDPADEFEILT